MRELKAQWQWEEHCKSMSWWGGGILKKDRECRNKEEVSERRDIKAFTFTLGCFQNYLWNFKMQMHSIREEYEFYRRGIKNGKHSKKMLSHISDQKNANKSDYDILLYILQYVNKTWALTNEHRDMEQHKFSCITVGVSWYNHYGEKTWHYHAKLKI